MGAKPKKNAGPIGLTREDILEAAKALVKESDVKSLTMRKLADRLGISPMATYRHFDNRQELIDALVEEAAREILEYPDLETIAWQDRIRMIAHQMLQVYERYPGLAHHSFRGIALDHGTLLIDKITKILLSAGYNEQEAPVRWFLLSDLIRSMAMRGMNDGHYSKDMMAMRDKFAADPDRHGFGVTTAHFKNKKNRDVYNDGLEAIITIYEHELEALKSLAKSKSRTRKR